MSEDDVEVPALQWWLLPGVVVPVVSNVHPVTGEFLGATEADPSPLEPDVWLYPAHSCQLSPPIVEAGYAAVLALNGSVWQQVPDHRGATVYSTITRAPRVWSELGALPFDFTLQAPVTEFDVWVDGQWVVDEVAHSEALRQQAVQKQGLLIQYATNRIAPLQDAVEMKVTTDGEEEALAEWRAYRIELNRMDLAERAPAAWPTCPDEAGATAWLVSQNAQ